MKPGSVLDGKYELRKRIGEGAMGVVWEGVNTRTEREVAVKVLLSSAGRDEDRQRLLREARAGGRIRHPNVLDIYDVAETDTGSPFIVMELLRGETLSARLERGPLPLEETLRILRDVARGLAAAHKAGVVHRDLRPHNVYLHTESDTSVPTVKLVEFAISRIDAEATLTLSGVTLGSPGYIAPEQIDGSDVDKRVDIWAFGALAYELFSGEPLFDGATPAEVIQQVAGGPIPELPRVAHELDADLKRLVAGCLVRDPSFRFQSMEDTFAIIDRVLARVSHPAMVALAERMPNRASDEDEPTTVTRRRGPRTERMGPRALMHSDSEVSVPTLHYRRPLNSDPDTITDVSVNDVKSLGTTKVMNSSIAPEPDEPPPSTLADPPRSAEEAQPTLLDPPRLDELREATSASDRPAPRTSSSPPRGSSPPPTGASPPPPGSSAPPPPGSEPPAYDFSLSSRASQMFQEATAPEKEVAVALARRKRVSRIAIVAMALVAATIGVAFLVRSIAASAVPRPSGVPTAASTTTPRDVEPGEATAAPSAEVAAPLETNPAPPEASATSTAAATSAASPDSAAPPATAESSASAKATHRRPPAPPSRPRPPPPTEGRPVFNPSSL